LITVLFLWPVQSELQAYFRQGLQDLPRINLIFPPKASPEELLQYAPHADVMVGWRPTLELLTAARNLKLVINPGAGVQHLIPMFRKINQIRPVALANGHGNSYFTAQHAVALLLTLMNRVVAHHNWLAAGKWRTGDDDAASIPLRDKTVGLLGYGAINRRVHRFLSGFDIDFAILRRGHSAVPVSVLTPATWFTPAELDSFLALSDIVMIAIPHTSLTENWICLPELERLGPGGLLVNVARGAIVNEADLFYALKTGLIAGAAIDVWYNYRPAPDAENHLYPYHHPFHELENVVLSPHRGASPFSDLKRWDEVIENIRRVERGENDWLNLVDLDREY